MLLKLLWWRCCVKLGYSEKATKFEKVLHIKFDITEYCHILSGRFFQILWPAQNIQTLFIHHLPVQMAGVALAAAAVVIDAN